MNYIRIFSTSSMSSSSSSRKSVPHNSEELSILRSKIASLKETVESLKVSVESRDEAIGTLAREKENLFVNLKTVQRTNRNLHQQLTDERAMHSKEKEYLIEVTRMTKNYQHQSYTYPDKCMTGDPQLNWLKEEITTKDEVICNICSRYLKIKSSKLTLQQKLEKLKPKSQKIYENIILLLQENKETLDELLEKLMQNFPEAPASRNYLKLLKNNANLHFENTHLKIYLSSHKDMTSERNELDTGEKQSNIVHETDVSKSGPKFRRSEFRLRSVHSKLPIVYKIKNITSRNAINVYRISSDPCVYQSYKKDIL